MSQTTEIPYHLTRVLVALHSYEDAGIAIRWGGALADALHLPVTLVHVLDESRLRADASEARAAAQDWLTLLSGSTELRNTSVDTFVGTGATEDELSRLGKQHPGAIVLFVAFPGVANGPTSMGMNLDRLIHSMETPFVVVPARSRIPERVRQIVVGMDQSPLAARVLNIARRMARSLDVEVTAVEAVEPGTIATAEFVDFKPIIRDDLIQVRGLASRVLLSTAQARDAAIIAVGSHGAGQSRHALMGSTSEWLSQHADRPVLIVPADRTASGS